MKKKASYGISHLNVNGKTIPDQDEIAKTFNDFFVNVGPETERSIPKVGHISPAHYLKNMLNVKFVLNQGTPEEIFDLIKILPNKSSGPNSIPLSMLKILSDVIIHPLSYVINLSFSSGVFPDALKIAKVLPLFKGGDSSDVNNYRPISLLSILDKIPYQIDHQSQYAERVFQ